MGITNNRIELKTDRLDMNLVKLLATQYMVFIRQVEKAVIYELKEKTGCLKKTLL